MNKKGPIIIIEDDDDDQFLFTSIFSDLNYENKVLYFANCEDALTFIVSASISPFIIISDIHLQGMDGIKIKDSLGKIVKPDINKIPFVFISTSVDRQSMFREFSISVQELKLKPRTYCELLATVESIATYWQICGSSTDKFEIRDIPQMDVRSKYLN